MTNLMIVPFYYTDIKVEKNLDNIFE